MKTKTWASLLFAVGAALTIGLILPASIEAAVPLPVAIRDAHVFIGNGSELPKATVLLRNGLIENIGPDLAIPPDAWVVDGSGLTVYPGFIDALSTWGIPSAAPHPTGAPGTTAQPSAPQPTAATRSHGPEDRPQTYAFERAADLVAPADPRLPVARAAGFTTAATFPNRGIVEGLGAMVDLAGERGRDMVVQQPVGQQIVLRTAGFRSGFPGSLMGDISYIRQLYLDLNQAQQAQSIYAAHPAGTPRPTYDHDLEGLLQSPRLLLPADESQQIDRMLQFGHELATPFVLYGLHEGFDRIQELKSANVPVLVSLKWPVKPKDGDPSDVPNIRDLTMREKAPTVPALLQKAGVKFAFFSDGLSTAPELRKSIKKAIDAGLPESDAIRALSLNAAEIYGLSDRLGSIEKGKIANVVVSKGNIFDEKSTVEYVFIDGAAFRPPPDVQNPTPPKPPENIAAAAEDEDVK